MKIELIGQVVEVGEGFVRLLCRQSGSDARTLKIRHTSRAQEQEAAKLLYQNVTVSIDIGPRK